MQEQPSHPTQDFSRLKSQITVVLPFLEQEAFYRAPTSEQIQALRVFLNCALSHIKTHQNNGLARRSVDYLTGFYNEAEDIVNRVEKGGFPEGAELAVQIKEGPVAIKTFMVNTIKTLFTYLLQPDRMAPPQEIKAHMRDVNHFPMVTRLKTAFGQKFFDKHPTAAWEAKSGTTEQGTILELRGVQIPQEAIPWFTQRLNGKFKYEFAEGSRGNKILRILDAENQILNERLNSTLSDPTLSAKKKNLENQFQARGLSVDVSQKSGWSRVLAQSIINGEIAPHHLNFTEEMIAALQQKIIEKFDELYSKGIQFKTLTPVELNSLLLDIQIKFVSQYPHVNNGL